jgi:Protein of unknown function (DUF3048) N-terminal domain/Protein of unknown function (DUF3048) C-terminal domain
VVRPAPSDSRCRGRAAVLVSLLAASLTACSGGSAASPAAAHPAVAAVPADTPTPAPTPTSTPRPDALLDPVVVQVENSPDARPQRGLAGASILYEYSAEGGISRFSAVYFHPPVGQVGPVRSARIATILLCGFYDAVLMYSGASDYIEARLRQSGVRHYDEDGALGDLFRIGSRYPPHNLYTDGGHMTRLLARVGDPVATYALWPRLDPGGPAPPGAPVRTVSVPISPFERPLYTWTPAAGGFLRTEPTTGPLIDAATSQPLVVPTVVVLQVPVRPAPEVVDVNGVMGLDHELLGTGPAQVFTGGLAYTATWQQDPHGPPRLLLPDGTPAPIAAGEVAVELVPTGSPAAVR